MADPRKRMTTNVPGAFFVDSTCIDCDACRQLAPGSFEAVGEHSAVTHQPMEGRALHEAYQALLACPVGAIGTTERRTDALRTARASFPLPLDETVSYCGFNSARSFGANSYFLRHAAGNWLIDSPRYTGHLVEAFETLGGIRYLFLSHEDDVADAERYAKRFGAVRIIHRADAHAQPGAEWIVDGDDVVEVSASFQIIPVPGHTPGSLAMLHDDRYLFTGDHLWWDRDAQRLAMPQVYVWQESRLRESAARLLNYRFEWVLPGHGDRLHLPVPDMQARLRQLVEAHGSGIARARKRTTTS